MPSNSNSKKIKFHFLESCTLKDRKHLKLFLSRLFAMEGKKLAALNYVFCSDKYLLKINKEYLNHDYYTDILTFILSDQKEAIIADIYISIPRVKENSLKIGVAKEGELLRVIFHGALHTCGYKDKTSRQKAVMRKKEDECLESFQSFT